MSAAEYTIRKKVFALLHGHFEIFNAEGNQVGYSRQKAFKLKEDIRVYRDESMQEEWMTIKARSIIDFSASYEVVSSTTGETLGVLQRKGLSSIIRDEWIVLDENEEQVGTIKEDSLGLALLRRFASNLIPQSFTLSDNAGNEFAEFRGHFNPFVQKLTVTVDEDCPLNPFVPLAAGILLVAIEGRQE
ncbi:hypothetical protein [Calycomorphotria hydatis]|uniref:Scramblase n=1 Tax=Calycomorphotria hydatis TaxID=2528027 RepID=A0A517T5Q7_9PLAN|nr:hypothetical protein [Calycomorphotria hydatis]QDT63699.1 hypothetical protein V22_09240 [Calycomorphotria hydatis]